MCDYSLHHVKSRPAKVPRPSISARCHTRAAQEVGGAPSSAPTAHRPQVFPTGQSCAVAGFYHP